MAEKSDRGSHSPPPAGGGGTEDAAEDAAPPPPVDDYATALDELLAVARDAERAAAPLPADAAAGLRRRAFAAALAARAVRRDVMLGIERRRFGMKHRAQAVLTEEARAVQLEHDVVAARQCLVVVGRHHKKEKNRGGMNLSTDEESFLKEHPAPADGETECALLKRRIGHEIDQHKERGKQYEDLAKQKVAFRGETKEHRKFFLSAVKPLEDLKNRVAAAYQAVARLPAGGLPGVLPGFLPLPLYVMRQCAAEAIAPSAVGIDGKQQSCEEFLRTGAHAKGAKPLELYPLRLLVSLSPDGVLADDTPTLRLYSYPKMEQVIVEAAHFDASLMEKCVDDADPAPKTYRFAGVEVRGCAAGWAQRAAEAVDGAILAQVRALLVERIAHRAALLRTVQRLRERGALNPPLVTGLVQDVLPGHPDPRVSVGDVEVKNSGELPPQEKVELPEVKPDLSSLGEKPRMPEGMGGDRWRHEHRERRDRHDREVEDWQWKKKELEKKAMDEQLRKKEALEAEAKRRWEAQCAAHFPKQLSLRVDQGPITYKVKVQVGPQYPLQPSQCQLKLKWREDAEAGGDAPASVLGPVRVPGQLAALVPAAAPVATPCFRSVCSVLPAGAPPAKRRRKRAAKGDAANGGDAGAQLHPVDPSVAFQEVHEYYDRFINRDVVRDVPPHLAGQVLVRQLLLSLYFIEQVHPHVSRRGVARLWSGCGGAAAAAAAGEVAPAAVQLLPHCRPLRRGREPALPLLWDGAARRWAFPAVRAPEAAGGDADDGSGGA